MLTGVGLSGAPWLDGPQREGDMARQELVGTEPGALIFATAAFVKELSSLLVRRGIAPVSEVEEARRGAVAELSKIRGNRSAEGAIELLNGYFRLPGEP